jgi:hypothetical protein
MYNPKLMGFHQPLTHLFNDGNGLPDRQLARSFDERFEVLPGDKFHGDIQESLCFTQVVHSADILVDDLSGESQLVAKALDHLGIIRDIRTKQLECDLFLYSLVKNLIDSTHTTPPQFLKNIVSVGEDAPS